MVFGKRIIFGFFEGEEFVWCAIEDETESIDVRNGNGFNIFIDEVMGFGISETSFAKISEFFVCPFKIKERMNIKFKHND